MYTPLSATTTSSALNINLCH